MSVLLIKFKNTLRKLDYDDYIAMVVVVVSFGIAIGIMK
jgi:hypothetical protein